MAEKKILVTQTRSSIRRPKEQLATLKSLGLGRVGRTVEHTQTPAVMGMVRRVSHLVQIQEAG